jgi:FkbM family methyltransferase
MDKSLIFDVGCHTGDDADFYLSKGFNVVAIEAHPDLCAGLRRRFREHMSAGRFKLIEKAIAEGEGVVEFFTCPDMDIWSTIRPDWVARQAEFGVRFEKITVPSVRFSSLLKEFGVPYYLKIDIEGADIICLSGLSEIADRSQFVSTEIEGRAALSKIDLLSALGYEAFQFVDQSAVPHQRPPYPAQEGVYVDYKFSENASGLFGRELPSSWTSRPNAMLRYYRQAAANRLQRAIGRGARPRWYDVHARFRTR